MANDPHAAGAASSADSNWVITDGNQRREVAFGKVDNNLSYLLGASQLLYLVPPLTFGTLGAPMRKPWRHQSERRKWQQVPMDQAPSNQNRPKGGVSVRRQPGDRMGGIIDPRLSKSVGVDHIRPSGRTKHNRYHSTRRLCTTSEHRMGGHHNGSRIRPPVHSRAKYPVRVSVAPGKSLHLRITIDATRPSKPVNPPQGAGITEVSIPGITFQPAMQLPSDEVAAFSAAGRPPAIVSISDPVTNPNLDFTGPIAAVEPAARRFLLPKPCLPRSLERRYPRPVHA